MLWQTLKVSPSHQNKENCSYKNIQGNECVWVKFKNYIQHSVCNISLNTDITFTVHIPSPITVQSLLFTKFQFARNAQNILRPYRGTHGHIWSWTVAHFHRSLTVAIGLTLLKTRRWRVSSFSILTEYARTLSVPTNRESAGLSSGDRGSCISKLFAKM